MKIEYCPSESLKFKAVLVANLTYHHGDYYHSAGKRGGGGGGRSRRGRGRRKRRMKWRMKRKRGMEGGEGGMEKDQRVGILKDRVEG